jgi:folate-binding protein YgfZ
VDADPLRRQRGLTYPRSVTSPFLGRPGAVDGVGVDAGVAAHYGDPLREQRTLIEQGGVVDRSHLGVVRVSGPERLTWLHSLLSQHVETLPAGEPREALILSPHGHVEQHMVVLDDGEATWLHVEPGAAQGLIDYLSSMIFWSKVEVSDVTASYGVLSVVGSVPRDLIVPRGELSATVDGLGVPLAGHSAWEALRVAARRPRLGFETDHRTIPHEVGWIGVAVHLDKGCYRGQETVARVHNLGRPPRRLVLVHLDGSREELPAPHTSVSVDGKDVGFLGTALHHAELGPIGLALVKRQVADDAQLVVEGMAAAIDPVASQDAAAATSG